MDGREVMKKSQAKAEPRLVAEAAEAALPRPVPKKLGEAEEEAEGPRGSVLCLTEVVEEAAAAQKSQEGLSLSTVSAMSAAVEASCLLEAEAVLLLLTGLFCAGC